MKWTILLTGIILSLILVGCGADQVIGPEIDDSKTGIKELTIKSDTLPREVFAERKFYGELVFQNAAGYDAENLEVSLLGLNRKYIELEVETQTINLLEGKNIYQKDGGIERFSFEGAVKSLAPGQNKESLRYLVLVKYSSKVEFSPTVCVDSGQYIVGAGCDYKNIHSTNNQLRPESFSGQGAPVAINNLEIVPYTGTNSEIELRMTLANRGKGNINSLRMGRAVLGGIPIGCEFKGRNVERPEVIEFKEKSSSEEVKLICIGRLESSTAYETPLFIELFYDYQLTVSKTLEIKR